MRAGAQFLLPQSALLTTILLGFAPGCEVDDRVLHGWDNLGGSQNRGGAASGGAARGGAGGSTGGRGGGAAGGSSGGQTEPGGGSGPDNSAGSSGAGSDAKCPDLDRNSRLDCEETLIENAGFDRSIKKWAAEVDADLSWDASDAHSLPESGSLLVKNVQMGEGTTLGMVAASLCVPVTPGERYSLYAETFIQAELPGGYAGATAWFFAQPDCSGPLIDASTSPLQGAVNAWKVIRLRPIAVPELATSMRLRLAVAKEMTAAPLSVQFDNVLLSR